MPTRQTLSLPNVQLSYLEWQSNNNNNQGTPLLLLHGLADIALVWDSLATHLSDRYHIIAPDMRGHGESSKPNNGYTFTEVITDLEALMKHLNWQNAHILAHSWSGKLATLWARESSARFRSMILVDPIFITKMPAVMKLTFPIVYKTLDCLKLMGPFPTLAAAETQARQLYHYADWSDLQQLVFQNSIIQKSDGSWGSKFAITARDQIFDEVMKFDGLTEPIYVPSLFIQPESGVNRMAWQINPYKTYLKNLKIQRVAGNHWAFLVNPDTFNQVVDNFLISLEDLKNE